MTFKCVHKLEKGITVKQRFYIYLQAVLLYTYYNFLYKINNRALSLLIMIYICSYFKSAEKLLKLLLLLLLFSEGIVKQRYIRMSDIKGDTLIN